MLLQVALLSQPELKSGCMQQPPSCIAVSTSCAARISVCCSPNSHPSDLVTVFRETKSPHPKCTSAITSTLRPLVLLVTSPSPFLPHTLKQPSLLFSGLQTSSLPEFMISAILLLLPAVLFPTEWTAFLPRIIA